MVQTFPLLSVSNFLSIRHKTKKILYTEVSYLVKLTSSVIIIVLYRPMHISLIIFFIIFLVLIYRKLHLTKYIAYKKISGNILILKFTILVCVLILGKNKTVVTKSYDILSNLNPNVLVDLDKAYVFNKQERIKLLFRHISNNCIKSIYRIEITSLISIMASQLLIIAIQPNNLLHLLNLSAASISTRSDLNLIFTFASQIYLLITDQATKVITALKIRTSNKTVESLFYQDKILEFFVLYTIRKKDSLKQEVMTSAQLSSNSLFRSSYTNLSIRKILFYSDKVLITFITLILCFLISI